MSRLLPKSQLSRKFSPRIRLRTVLVVPFVLQIFTAVGLVGYFSFRNGQQAVNDLADQLINKASQQVDEHLDSYLRQPLQLAQINLQAINSGDLNPRDPQASDRYFWRQSQAFPDLAYIGYSLADGTEVGAGRWIQGLDTVLYENLPGANNTADYAADTTGNRTQRLQTYDYDPVSDEWYQDAAAAGKLIWTRIYASESTNIQPNQLEQKDSKTPGIDMAAGLNEYVALSASAPVYDKAGRLLGVTSADLLLKQISEFLRQLQVSPSGQIFIVGPDGLLVASSSSQPIYHRQNDEIVRHQAAESPDPMIRAVMQGVQQVSSLQAIQSQQRFELTIAGQRQYVQVMPWKDEYGLDWRVVITVPEVDFMAQIDANRQITIWLCLAALVIATLLGLYTSERIARPILALNHASEAIAEGQFDQTLSQQVRPSRIRELDALRQSFNHMAAQLKASFLALEHNNAQLEQRVTERTQELAAKNAQLQTTLTELHSTQTQMIQAEKMSALGQMVAGIAHEINNPVNFIYGNLAHVSTYTKELLALVQAYQQHLPNPPQSLQSQIEAIDLDFLSEDAVKLLQSMKVGTDRIREIVLSLRNFSRLDEAEYKAVDLHEGLENTLLLLRHRLQNNAQCQTIELIRRYGNLPLVECYAGQINQVFMNLLNNAIDAVNESEELKKDSQNKPTAQSTIWIHTELIDSSIARITISDNGMGISELAQAKLFDPFSTTKPVGKGTGLGLSISYQTITEKHGGQLYYRSTPGEGTKFIVEIPVRQSTVHT